MIITKKAMSRRTVLRGVGESELVGAADLPRRRDPDREADDDAGQRGLSRGEDRHADPHGDDEGLETRLGLGSRQDRRDRPEREDRGRERPEVPKRSARAFERREAVQVEGETGVQPPGRLGARGQRHGGSTEEQQLSASHAREDPAWALSAQIAPLHSSQA